MQDSGKHSALLAALPHHFRVVFLEACPDEHLPEPLDIVNRVDLTEICEVDRVGVRFSIHMGVQSQKVMVHP